MLEGVRSGIGPLQSSGDSIVERVAQLARISPRAPAVIQARERSVSVWSWEKLWRESERIAALLLNLGVQAREVVAHQLPNRAEAVAITLASARIGAVCCALEAVPADRDLILKLSRSRTRVLFVADEFSGTQYAAGIIGLESELPYLEHLIVVRTSAVKTRLPTARRLRCSRLQSLTTAVHVDPAEIERRRASPDALVQLIFSPSEDGGPCRGILHRQEALLRAADLYASRLQIRRDDRVFVVDPMARQSGFLYGMWTALALGIPQILQPVWDPERALRLMRQWRGSIAQGSPAVLGELVGTAQKGVRSPGNLRVFVTMGALPPELAEQAARWLQTRTCEAFGTPEGCLTTLNGPSVLGKSSIRLDSNMLPSVLVRVVDRSGNAVPAGREGYLQTHSPTLFACYLDEPELTAEAFTVDGWYRTADLAVLDEGGFLHVRRRHGQAAIA